MTEGQADKCAARQRVMDGSLFSQEIGQQDQAIGTSGKGFGCFVQLGEAGTRCKLITEPLDDAPTGSHATVYQELAGDDMVIQEQAGNHQDMVNAIENIANPSQLDQQIPLCFQPSREGRSDMVAPRMRGGALRPPLVYPPAGQ